MREKPRVATFKLAYYRSLALLFLYRERVGEVQKPCDKFAISSRRTGVFLTSPLTVPFSLAFLSSFFLLIRKMFHFPAPINSVVFIYKGKAVPLQAWSGPEGSRKLRFPDFMTMAQGGGKVVSLTHRPPLPPGNTPGIHFC